MGERKTILVLITWLQTHGNKPKFGKQLEGKKKSKKEMGNESRLATSRQPFKDQHLDKSQHISSNLWLFVGLNKDFKMNPVATDGPHMDPGLKSPFQLRIK